MRLAILIQDTGDTEIAKHQFCMLFIAEEEIGRFDVLMQDIALMTICQSSCALKGNTTELIQITIKMILAHRTTAKVLHEFVITMLAFYISLTVIVNPDDHLKIEIVDCLEDLSVDIEIWIVYLQDIFLIITFYEKNLGFTRIITQRLNVPIVHSFQHEEFILHILSLWHGTNPICTIHLRNCHGSIRWSHRCISDTYVRCLTTCLIIISHLIGIERLCRTHYKSSLISFFEFLPRITHLPPI